MYDYLLCCIVIKMTESSAWAQLVSTNDIETEPVQLEKDKIAIGRNRGLVVLFLQIWDVFLVLNAHLCDWTWAHCDIRFPSAMYKFFICLLAYMWNCFIVNSWHKVGTLTVADNV